MQGHSRALGTEQVGEDGGPRARIIASSLALLRRSHAEGAFESACVVWFVFPLGPHLSLPFWGICTEKQQREHFKGAARLSCCSDNCGVIGNHLCKLRYPLNGACRKCGYSFSRPVFSFSCKIILRFSCSGQLMTYYVLAREWGDPVSEYLSARPI